MHNMAKTAIFCKVGPKAENFWMKEICRLATFAGGQYLERRRFAKESLDINVAFLFARGQVGRSCLFLQSARWREIPTGEIKLVQDDKHDDDNCRLARGRPDREHEYRFLLQ